VADIFQWSEIESQFTGGSLLIGNGSSIAVSSNFSYSSLFEVAKNKGYLTEPVQEVFNKFGVDDFELVLRRLWQAKLVNEALGIDKGQVEVAYENVRTALINTVREIHVTYEDAQPHLQHIAVFTKQFETVLSLNYDLILYWAMMYENSSLGGNWFKDCFFNNEFQIDWGWMNKPFHGVVGTTLVFYPHGNLILYRKKFSSERKLLAGIHDLLMSIFNEWERKDLAPLFVCEGLEENKRESIGSSDYLERVFYEVIPSLKGNLVIYGWGFGDQDEHILEQVKKAGVTKVAVSIRNENEVAIGNAATKLNSIGIEDISFFDSASKGCWNNPSEEFEKQEAEAVAIVTRGLAR
jgi:hypothetical protein